MNILLVQPFETDHYSYKTLFDQVLSIKEQQQVDLVVFPEGFSTVENEDEGWDFVRYTSALLKTPVICGLSYYDGRERAVYVNAVLASGETAHAIFVKQPIAEKLTFEMDRDLANGAKPYESILLNGHRIQVHMGHEVFSPVETIEQEGVDILINLTSSDVRKAEWCNVLKEQSVKLDAIVLCTMVNRANKNQPSGYIGFKSGERLKANYKLVNGEMAHAFSLYSIDNLLFEEEVVESVNDINKLQ